MTTPNPPDPTGSYAYARRAGNLLFLAGIGPRRHGTKDIPGVELDAQGRMISYDIEAQVRQCFANVKMVLEEHGSKWENIVDVLVFLTDMERDFPTANRLWGEYFPPRPPPPPPPPPRDEKPPPPREKPPFLQGHDFVPN